MAVTSRNRQMNKICKVTVLWNGKATDKNLFNLYAMVRNELLKNGEEIKYEQLAERVRMSKSVRETIEIIKEYVDFR